MRKASCDWNAVLTPTELSDNLGGRGEQCSTLRPFWTLLPSDQSLFDIAVQRTDPLFGFRAPSALAFISIISFFVKSTLKISKNREIIGKIGKKLRLCALTHLAASAQHAKQFYHYGDIGLTDGQAYWGYYTFIR